ncbi:DUF2279 domain-containing protein [Yeosuana sp. MJ-SS3]|uniref:DUF2279 domain-containing protein n=1 Tax=Gilvirhabdus luticola TaxID=3079858 RepID=A0ABU3UA95_9FLAO|nr:DUF2279 domain-containing protein [Yeosuana sp. MJ-SS3]MDU8887327.1 DUF2279 domain-containing protein [Yeosuana sp. MJ-SS3]
MQYRKYCICFFLFIFFCLSTFSQSKINNFLKPSDTLNKPRRNAVVITEATLAGITLIGLNELWYNDYPRSKFHVLNDNEEWLQIDKFGHVFTSYQLGRFGANILNWSGVDKKEQLIYGGTLGFVFLTTIEVLDGFSEEWGFSWGDIAANAVGTGLYISQELLWEEQRIALKYSFHQTKYASMNPEKLGDSFSEQVLKDYNGQTYWLSANIHSFFKEAKLPKWLNVAVGYGAEGMLYGIENSDNELIEDSDRVRQYYLSLDIDLTKIKTNSHLLRSILDVLNVFKVPFPTIEFNKNRVAFHLFYY